MDFLALPGVQVAIAGAAGGLARWIFLRPSLMDGLGSVLLGVLLGFYVSPYFEPMIEPMLSGFAMDQTKLPTFAAFATGVGGVGVVGFISDLWKFRRKKLSASERVDDEDRHQNGDEP